jgi:predicted amidophosphoribosyltransferase
VILRGVERKEWHIVAEFARIRGMRRALTWLRTSLARGATAAGDLLFPPACAICGDEVAPDRPLFCSACLVDLWPGDKNFCPRCAKAYPDLPNPEGTCAQCREDKPVFVAARTLGVYAHSIEQIVLRTKHRAFEPLAMQAGRLLAERIEAAPFDPKPDLVAPVPMYWLKRLWRGTSAADSLAHAIGQQLQIPCITDLVRCVRWTDKQSSLPASKRDENVRGAYGIGWGFDIRGTSVLIVDDVVTTGSTCNAVARELKRAGAERVYVASVARAANA